MHGLGLVCPIPNIDILKFDRFPKASFITSVDLKDVFFPIPLHTDSRDETAFTILSRLLYQYKMIPFGLCNAPQIMSKVIAPELRNEVFVSTSMIC